MEVELFRLVEVPKLAKSTLIVGWNEDAGGLGEQIIEYLKANLSFRELGEIELTQFFSLNGVSVENNVAKFPESKFYFCPEKDLVLFQSNTPHLEWYRFLSTVLDVAVDYCHVQEIYTLGGMISMASHNVARDLMTVVNQPEMKPALSRCAVNTEMDYETPVGQRPTLSSFLLWLAQKRSIPAVSLWVPIPFYLLPVNDPEAYRQVLDFFNRRLNLGLDFTDLEEEISEQYKKITAARLEFPELDSYLTRLENNVNLNEEENEILMRRIIQILSQV